MFMLIELNIILNLNHILKKCNNMYKSNMTNLLMCISINHSQIDPIVSNWQLKTNVNTMSEIFTRECAFENLSDMYKFCD